MFVCVMLQQTSLAALMQSPHVGITSSLPVAVPSSAVIPAYNTSTMPRMHMMPAAASGPQLSANIARPRVPLHIGQMSRLPEQVCGKVYDACNTTAIQAGNMASMHAQVWQQNSQFSSHQPNSRLQPQPMSAYMTQQPHVQAPVSGCGTVPDWSRFSGQLPYQQLPQYHQLRQQRHQVPSGTVIRQQLPTYQSVVDERLHQDMLLKHTWQQQQQRHLMHFQSVSHHHSTVAGVASEPCDVGGFRQAASDACMMSLTAPASAVSSAV